MYYQGKLFSNGTLSPGIWLQKCSIPHPPLPVACFPRFTRFLRIWRLYSSPARRAVKVLIYRLRSIKTRQQSVARQVSKGSLTSTRLVGEGLSRRNCRWAGVDPHCTLSGGHIPAHPRSWASLARLNGPDKSRLGLTAELMHTKATIESRLLSRLLKLPASLLSSSYISSRGVI